MANLKLLGKQTTQHLIGPRGYKQQDDEEEEEDEEGEGGDADGAGGDDEASRDAVKPRWRGLFKLAKSKDMPALDASEKSHGAGGCARAAAVLKRHGQTLSYPLSVVAASWLFPVVKYALMLGVSGGGAAAAGGDRDDDDSGGGGGGGTGGNGSGSAGAAGQRSSAEEAPPTQPAQLHVVGASEAECAAAAGAWWLVGYGCQLDKPGVAITFVGPDVPLELHGGAAAQAERIF